MPSWKKVIISGSNAILNTVSASSFTGSFTGSFLGTASYANSSLSSSFALTSSFSVSSSYALSASRAVSSSHSLTSSYVNPLTQNVLISGSLTVGSVITSSNTENTLNIYPPPAGGTGEGGQILLAASGGLYTSASMLDTWQDNFRLLRGSNTGGSNAALIVTNLQSGDTNFTGAITASAYSGLPNSYLYVTRNANQTILVGNWANRDVIFDTTVYSSGISYSTVTGLATLIGGSIYRITSRLAWNAAAVYLIQYSCFDSSNIQLGPVVEIVQPTNTSNNISDGTLDFIYAPTANTDIKIRTTNTTTALNGEFIRGDLNTQMIIQQIA